MNEQLPLFQTLLLQAQPSRTSCGPTCVAMIARVQAADVIALLPRVRSAKRSKKRTHYTNIAEVLKLLSFFGFNLDRRLRFEDVTDSGDEFGLLRVHTATASGHRRGWHWCVIAQGQVSDPSMAEVRDIKTFLAKNSGSRIYFYAVTKAS